MGDDGPVVRGALSAIAAGSTPEQAESRARDLLDLADGATAVPDVRSGS